MANKVQKREMWVAALLTCGEWAMAFFMLVRHGEVIALYLAITYVVRETSGGKHHHEIFIHAARKVYEQSWICQYVQGAAARNCEDGREGSTE